MISWLLLDLLASISFLNWRSDIWSSDTVAFSNNRCRYANAENASFLITRLISFSSSLDSEILFLHERSGSFISIVSKFLFFSSNESLKFSNEWLFNNVWIIILNNFWESRISKKRKKIIKDPVAQRRCKKYIYYKRFPYFEKRLLQ